MRIVHLTKKDMKIYKTKGELTFISAFTDEKVTIHKGGDNWELDFIMNNKTEMFSQCEVVLIQIQPKSYVLL